MSLSSNEFLTDDEFSALKTGNKTVFRKIYDQYVGLVQYTVTRCGIEQSLRNDIVQEVFLKLFNVADTIKNKNAIKSWLLVSARNLCLDHFRKDSRIIFTDDESILQTEDNEKSTKSSMRELEILLVGKLIVEISKETNDTTLHDFYIRGLSAKIIAEKNSEAISTVTNRLSRLRKKYRERFTDYLQTLRDNID